MQEQEFFIKKWGHRAGQFFSSAVCFFIQVYRVAVSPSLGMCCRFYPSCSQYTYEAIQAAGVLRGGAYALMRILKCNPFYPGGADVFEK